MKRLIALLALLLLGPAMAQENPYANAIPTGNLVPDFSFDGPINTIPQGWQQIGAPGSGGSIQGGCGALSNQGQCYMFSYGGATLSTNIDLSSYQTNSFEFYFDFFYRMNCNNSIGGYCQNPDGPQDLFGASVQFFTTNGEAGSFNFIPIGPDYFKAGDPGVNEYNYKAVGWYSSQQSEFLFTSAIISFYGRDEGFWAGYYGPALDRVNFRIGYLPAPEEPTITTDCTLTPSDPNCAVLVYTDPALIADALVDEVVADATTTDTTDETLTGSDDGSDDGTEVVEEEEEEVLVADTVEEETYTDTVDETEESEEETVVETIAVVQSIENQAAYRELTDEEKAAILADAISKTAIETALAIANTAAVSGSNTEATNTTTRTTVNNTNNDDDNKQVADINKQETQQSESSDSGLELLETGRTMGQSALANVLASSSETATEANNQAESIVQASNTNTSSEVSTRQATIDMDSYDVPTFSNDQQSIEQSTLEAMIEVVDNDLINNGLETFVTEDGRVRDMPGVTNSTELEIETLALLEMIKQSSSTDDDSKTFEEPVVATVFDPTNPSLVTTNNVMNLEILGVIGSKVEEKTDAEKRAEEVVAANQQQMEEINKNYMDADQSGIVAAISGDTDVTSYRSAMLPDNNLWYKPEDIYKKVTYKDNVRGMYFLEKGNTDTYNKMVEEQYK
jgi:hypothetical protein